MGLLKYICYKKKGRCRMKKFEVITTAECITKYIIEAETEEEACEMYDDGYSDKGEILEFNCEEILKINEV
jgi:hypothetical protein